MTALIGRVDPPDLHVMTFNMRRRVVFDPRPSDHWPARREPLRALLSTELPTILGVQEAMPDQARFISAVLGDRYRSIGRGRDRDGHGEACPLFYDAERLELLDAEQTWLSTRPEIPGSRSWGSAFPRIVVTAVFVDRSTSARFTVMNTHFDPFSAPARLRSAEIVRQKAAEAGTPAIAMGDLNAPASSPALRALLSGDTLRDAWAGAAMRITPPWGTFANYRPPRVGGDRIDWIVVTSGVDVRRSAIHGRSVDGRWPSDHLPVQTVLRLDGDHDTR